MQVKIFKNKIIYVVLLGALVGILTVAWLVIFKDKNNNVNSNNETNKSTTAVKEKPVVGIPVTYMVASRRNIDIFKRSIGNVYNFNSALVSSEVDGMVSEIIADVGDTVEVGQVLANIDKRQLLNNRKAQEAEVARLRLSYKDKNSTLKRYKTLNKEGFISEAELETATFEASNLLEQIRNAEASLANINIKIQKSTIESPIKGIIQRREVGKGNFVNIGTLLFEVVDNSKLVILADYPEADSRFFKKGQAVLIKSPLLEEDAKAVVKEIKPLIDGRNRSIQLVIDYDNSAHILKPGSVIDVYVLLQNKVDVVAIPEEAIVARVAGSVVYVIDEATNKVIEKKVATGQSQNGIVEIVSGLEGNEKIVLDGAGFLTDGALVKPVLFGENKNP